MAGGSGEVAALKSDFRTTTWPPILVCQVPRHVLRDVKTWRGFDASSFGRIFHQWWNTPDREYLKAGFPALGLADQIQFFPVAELDEVALHHPTA